MKINPLKSIVVILANFICTLLVAQKQNFEGLIVYKNSITSKVEGISESDWENFLVTGKSTSVLIKNGNYKQVSDVLETYYITKDQKAYLQYKGIDTLYFINYSKDTSTVIAVEKPKLNKQISGLDCNTIIIKTPTSTSTYLYSPQLYMNPEYNKENRIGNHDVFAKETSSLFLSLNEETNFYTSQQECTSWKEQPIADSVFALPQLPMKEFSYYDICIEPVFKRSGGWAKYLQTNINAEIGSKYVKIPRGEAEAIETVLVNFVIDPKGKVLNAQVLNKKEVHPRIATEALRVVNESPIWRPASFFGKTILYLYTQPVSFLSSKN